MSQIKTRMQQKIDTTANWEKAINFIPLKGEIIVYQDDNVPTKIKIGDGTTKVNDLDFLEGSYVDYSVNQSLTNEQQAQARINIGVPTFYSGTTEPTDDIGNVGDIYFVIGG